jgi:hypothetical protein
VRKSKAHVLTGQIAVLQQELKVHQEKCKHPERYRTYKYGANTGNYDPTCDVYWTDYHCELCLKKWHVMDQHGTVGRRL